MCMYVVVELRTSLGAREPRLKPGRGGSGAGGDGGDGSCIAPHDTRLLKMSDRSSRTRRAKIVRALYLNNAWLSESYREKMG